MPAVRTCPSGTGLDFSAASAVVFVELPQEVALVRQAEDRAHRHGQKLSVNVYFLVAKGTSDERRYSLCIVPAIGIYRLSPHNASTVSVGSEHTCWEPGDWLPTEGAYWMPVEGAF